MPGSSALLEIGTNNAAQREKATPLSTTLPASNLPHMPTHSLQRVTLSLSLSPNGSLA